MVAWRTHVTVVGRVIRVRLRLDGGWRVRLADTGGALAAADFPPTHSVALPPIGAWIVVRGSLRYDDYHEWYVVDPVEEWVEAEMPPCSSEKRSNDADERWAGNGH